MKEQLCWGCKEWDVTRCEACLNNIVCTSVCICMFMCACVFLCVGGREGVAEAGCMYM